MQLASHARTFSVSAVGRDARIQACSFTLVHTKILFVSFAHSDQDIDDTLVAAKETVRELRDRLR